jgi:hypothetical protein
MNHLDPYLVRGHQQDPLAATHHRRLVRAGFHPAPPVVPVHRLLPKRPERRTS